MQPTEIRRLVWWAFGVALALIAIYAIGYGTRLGWLGVGLIGLAVLLLANRVDLEADHPGSLHGSAELNLVARQMSERSRARPEDRLALVAARAERRRILSVVRGIGLVLTIVGFGLFVKQQL